MKVKLDENLPVSLVEVLAGAGHDVDTVHDEGLGGAPDPVVVARAREDGRLLLTLDRGLGDVRAYPPGSHAGIVVLRLDHQSPRATRGAVVALLTAVDLTSLAGAVAVWRNGDLRVRHAPGSGPQGT